MGLLGGTTVGTREILDRSPVIPVLVVEDVADAAPLARALVAGGLDVLEVTLRSPVALEAAVAMKEAVPGAVVGLGTILTPAHLQGAEKAGLDFGVSPGLSASLLDALERSKLPFLPGSATVSEAMELHASGFRALKFFPAAASGGATFLKAIHAVLPDLVYCPTGGVTADSAANYLALPNVAAVGGSWIAPTNLIRAGDWAEIETRARHAAGLRDGQAVGNIPSALR